VLDIALFGDGAKIPAAMIEISSTRPRDSSGRQQLLATCALLGVLGALLVAQLAPWGDGDKAGTVISVAVGAVVGAAAGRFSRAALLVVVDAVLLALYLIVALTPLMTPISTHWARVDSLPPDTLAAVVALSSGMNSDSALSSTAADRLLSALELMRAGHGRRLFTTRDVQRFGSRTLTTDSDQRRLIGLASMTSRWTIVDSVHTTHDEATRSAAILLPMGEQAIIVVTSPMHTHRACAVFEAVGFKVYCQAARERDHVTYRPYGAQDRLAAARAFGYELLAMVKDRLHGWLTPRAVVTPGPRGSS
jgi:uncharacterized SAM-binding protein YcdF (DUF218 family)